MRNIKSWNEKWAFSKEAAIVPETMPQNWHWVELPHTWNAIDGQDGGNDYYRGLCYYAKTCRREDLPAGEEVYLEIGAANSSAEVYVNGKKLAYHHGGYSKWRVHLTPALQEENLIVLAVSNEQKKWVYPQMADFTFYGGLYREVRLIGVPHSHFALLEDGSDGIYVTPKVEGADARVEIRVSLENPHSGQKLRYRIYDREGQVVQEASKTAGEKQVDLRLRQVHLWQGRWDPYLYQAEVTLLQGEEVLDQVRTSFGCRSFEIHGEDGFFLNGKSYPLRGVSRHQDWKGLGNALKKEHHRRDMELIEEMGANTIRLAHYQQDPYFYQLCDEAGMVVWAEIPYISKHVEAAEENAMQQMRELILQNYNHPSIVVWGLSNEITMAGKTDEGLLETHRQLNQLCHELDPGRKTAVAVVSMCEIEDPYLKIPDVVSYNHYFGWYGGETSMNGPWLDHFHETFPRIPIGMSEYGCEGLNWHTSHPVQGDYTEEYQAYYHEELIKQLFTRPYLWATHVWNMFDFGADSRQEGGENGQNHKGLVTFDRSYKKDAFYAYKAWLSKEPFVHICGKRYVDRVEEVTQVKVYSNQETVELFANGISLGRQTCPNHFFTFQVPNKGETKLEAVAGECRDQSRIRKVPVFQEAYRLQETGTVLNWFDIETVPDGFSLHDKVQDVAQTKEGRKVIGEMVRKMSANNAMFQGEHGEKMAQMLGGFTVLRMCNLMGAAGEKMTKDELLALNKRLHGIQRESGES